MSDDEDIWEAYEDAWRANASKIGSNPDTKHMAGLVAVYEMGKRDGASDES